jgi:sugar lactone lactonase YvrE
MEIQFVEPALVFGQAGKGEGEFAIIDGIWVDRQGRILVVDKGNNRVYFFSGEGRYLGSFGSPGTGEGQFDRCTGILVDSRERIIISDQGNARIQVFDPEGRFMQSFGKRGSGDGEFLEPMGLALDRQGFLYVTDGTRDDIQVFDPHFNFVKKIESGGPIHLRLKRVESIAVSPAREIFVADEKNSRIQRFSFSGERLSFIGHQGTGPGTFLEEVEGITFDASGFLYAIDERGGKIEIFSPDGKWLHAFGGGTGKTPGSFNSPDGLHYSPRFDSLLVADQRNNRVQVFRLKDIWKGKIPLADYPNPPIAGEGASDRKASAPSGSYQP